jgi:hypothetical protein
MPNKVPPLFRAMLVSGALALSFAGAHAQSPAGLPFRVDVPGVDDQILSDVVATGDGKAFVLWQRRGSGEPLNRPDNVFLRAFETNGQSGPPFVAFRTSDFSVITDLCGNASGELVMTVSHFAYGGFSVRRYGFPKGRGSFWLTTPLAFGQVPFGCAVDPAGNTVIIWISRGQEAPDQVNLNNGVYARLFDPSGQPRGKIIHVNTFEQGDQNYPAVAISPSGFVVVWHSSDQDGSGFGVYGQRFSAGGQRLGSEFLVPNNTTGDQYIPRVAVDPHGNFIVTWTGMDPSDPNLVAVFARRFDVGGKPIGDEFRVSGAKPYTSALVPDIASDAEGNFAIAWGEQPRFLSFLRLYRSTGEPVRGPVPLTRVPGWYSPRISFAGDGTLATAWTAINADPGQFYDVYYQRFSASPGSEACLFRNGEFDCDTGRTGGPAEVRYTFGQAGDVGMLGDLDGDGRADPCVYRTSRFLCDVAHNPSSPPVEIDFGQAGDLPLLGDIDGDGKADPCVYRDQTFLCDPGHMGQASVAIKFGQPGDVPLLGDIDSDGRADPCVYRNLTFLCDPGHTGAPTVSIQFGQAGDVPFLGDFDGDGRADPCVLRGSTILCDTGHGTGGPPLSLSLAGGGGIPLLANLDGL